MVIWEYQAKPNFWWNEQDRAHVPMCLHQDDEETFHTYVDKISYRAYFAGNAWGWESSSLYFQRILESQKKLNNLKVRMINNVNFFPEQNPYLFLLVSLACFHSCWRGDSSILKVCRHQQFYWHFPAGNSYRINKHTKEIAVISLPKISWWVVWFSALRDGGRGCSNHVVLVRNWDLNSAIALPLH